MNWIVLFRWPLDVEGDPPRVFSCLAGSGEEAEGRCRAADPNAEVVWVHAGGDAGRAKWDWAACHRSI
jgi:hypothetical protein